MSFNFVIMIVFWGFFSFYVPPLPITTKVVSMNPAHGEVYSIQHYVIKFVSDLQKVGGFLRVLPSSSTNKTDHHDITEILLKVALNTINLSLTVNLYIFVRFICILSFIFFYDLSLRVETNL